MENDRKTTRRDTEHYDLEFLLRRPSLRTNIPRKASQVSRGVITTSETTCGAWCLRGQWLQSFANRNSFCLIYGVLGSLYGSYHAYFSGVITSLEKRFKISSQTTGIIAAAGDISLVVMCFVVSPYAPTVHRPKWMGVGVLLIVASAIVFALPHFLYEPKSRLRHDLVKNHKNETDETICGKSQSCFDDLEESNGPIVLFILAQVLQGIGGALYFVTGKDYKDENTERWRPPALLSLLSVIKILGPAFGYWLSSMSLKISEYPSLTPHATDEEPQWIGAWWLGCLVIGFILAVLGFLVSLFPTTLPKTAVNRIMGAEITRKATNERGETETLQGMFKKSIFNCTKPNITFNSLGFLAYFIFLPKYVEINYRQSASKANLIAGSVAIISSAVGIVMANSVITRYDLSARTLASWTVVVGVLSVGGPVSYFYLNCPASDNQIQAMITRNLNITCNCTNLPISPACNTNGQAFISPSQAGCENIYNSTTPGYEMCIHKMIPVTAADIFKGYCPVDCQLNFLKFVIITCSITFFYATGYASHYWFNHKLEEMERKPDLLNSGINLLGLLATVPAPIIFGYLIDKSCLIWEGNCRWTRNCWLYDNHKLRLSVNWTAIAFAVIHIILDLSVWYSVRDLE